MQYCGNTAFYLCNRLTKSKLSLSSGKVNRNFHFSSKLNVRCGQGRQKKGACYKRPLPGHQMLGRGAMSSSGQQPVDLRDNGLQLVNGFRKFLGLRFNAKNGAVCPCFRRQLFTEFAVRFGQLELRFVRQLNKLLIDGGSNTLPRSAACRRRYYKNLCHRSSRGLLYICSSSW